MARIEAQPKLLPPVKAIAKYGGALTLAISGAWFAGANAYVGAKENRIDNYIAGAIMGGICEAGAIYTINSKKINSKMRDFYFGEDPSCPQEIERYESSEEPSTIEQLYPGKEIYTADSAGKIF